MNEIEPCPRCGSKELGICAKRVGWSSLVCEDCGQLVRLINRSDPDATLSSILDELIAEWDEGARR